jgi:hypothetical protein
MWWVLGTWSSGMHWHANGYVYTSVLQEPATSIFRVEMHHWRWKQQFCLKCCNTSTQLHFTEKTWSWNWCKSHINTCQWHISQHQSLLLWHVFYTTHYQSFKHVQYKKKPYLSPWIIYRLSQCSLSSCLRLTVQFTVHVLSSLLLNGSWR